MTSPDGTPSTYREIGSDNRILPDLVFAVLMPYLGPEAAEDEMRRVAASEGTA